MEQKKLGQHFLTDKNAAKLFVEPLSLKKGDWVIEVGPGEGIITELLAKIKEIKVIAVEKDGNLAKKLNNKFANSKDTVRIVAGDILHYLPQAAGEFEKKALDYKLTGNLPFYLTGYFLRLLGELQRKPKISVLGIQKEVAEKLIAAPPKMNLLAASVQFWAEIKLIGTIPKKKFSPQPKVDGAIVVLKVKKYPGELFDSYCDLIKVLFKHPRKTVGNNIKLSKPTAEEQNKIKTVLEALGIDLKLRPQDLEIKNLIRAAKFLTQQTS